jgi:hypothetical protein
MIREMNLRVPPTDHTMDYVLVLVVLAILGIIGYRYWYLPKTNGDGKFPWERKS